MKLVLGAAQFGFDYGITNKNGRVPQDEIIRILSEAKKNGINIIDTAVNYGASEKSIGDATISNDWRVITKLPEIPNECNDIHYWVQNQVLISLKKLKAKSLHGVLLHRPLQLLGPRGKEIFSAISELKRLGLVGKVGISVYGPEEIEHIIALYKFDIVQCPFNLLDQRILKANLLYRLKDLDYEVYSRSTFLQGVLLMTVNEQLTNFGKWTKTWNLLAEWQKIEKVTPLETCLRFPSSFSEIDGVIVGVDNIVHLQEIIQAYSEKSIEIPKLGKIDESLINPTLWKTI